MTFTNVFAAQGLPDIVTQQPVGNISGGALEPTGALCNCCGTRLSLNLGTIAWTLESNDPFVTSISRDSSFRDYWEFLDEGGILPTVGFESFEIGWSAGTLSSAEYVAYLDFSDPASGCEPTIRVIFGFPSGNPGDVVGPGEIRVTASGAGTASYIEIDGDAASATFGGYGQFFTMAREGVVVASCIGVYSGSESNQIEVTEQAIFGARNT